MAVVCVKAYSAKWILKRCKPNITNKKYHKKAISNSFAYSKNLELKTNLKSS